ncbi:hypothetical protein BO83DRAFT_412591 [Aspergillus eucalypticola CBS 122712]|uniref:Uncharacterized protein n=1 Tax=Aspergillus eucalypticola (strain CBS 122712 / IBT 29274) TaxID=1448314 RepID=A0A317UPE4_ASPEC|nr:uncharacterized protein BO83DRAFT_412591 [Aspergillus eucalypticola CBS 122712]PWY62417.1 hypothetical protein BO83DRAFT_412591 [Aspergillus eucalypticola CBS 122712]
MEGPQSKEYYPSLTKMKKKLMKGYSSHPSFERECDEDEDDEDDRDDDDPKEFRSMLETLLSMERRGECEGEIWSEKEGIFIPENHQSSESRSSFTVQCLQRKPWNEGSDRSGDSERSRNVNGGKSERVDATNTIPRSLS